MLLSIDVGIKNLALCVLHPTDKTIHFWEVSGVPPLHKDGVFLSLKKHLDERGDHFSLVDTVIIEKQPPNGIKSVEHFLHTYFLCKEKKVILWDAKHKVPDVVGSGKKKYKERKDKAVERCREAIRDSEHFEFFESHEKKDDLADCYLQAISFFSKETKTTKQTCRKPTEQQTRTKYSPSNLAWIVKNNESQDARFLKDLSRYYSSVDELKKDFNITV
jgi:hypothetical protein